MAVFYEDKFVAGGGGSGIDLSVADISVLGGIKIGY